jgi:sortase A
VSSVASTLDIGGGAEPVRPDLEARLQEAGAALGALEGRAAAASAEGARVDERDVLASLARAVDGMIREVEGSVAATTAARGADLDTPAALEAEYRFDVAARTAALRARLERVAGEALLLPAPSRTRRRGRRRRATTTPPRAPAPAPVGPPARAPIAPMAEPRARRSTAARIALAGRILTVMGVCLAVFFAYEFLLTPLTMTRSQTTLLTEFRAEQAVGSVVPTTIRHGIPVALIQIPRLGLDRVVVEGTGPQALKNGPGHLPGSALPGEFGNAVLAGHRTTYGGPFRSLNLLHPGDVIVATAAYGAFVYRVAEVRVIRPGQPDEIGPTLDSRLTLFTSDPAYTAVRRLVVIAKLTGDPAAFDRRPQAAVAPSELGTGGDAAGLLLAAFWGAIAAAVILLARRLRFLWPPVAVYLGTVPIVVALAWLVCENLDRIFPSTI